MVNETAERLEERRDLKAQIAELRGREDEGEIIFRETSPRRRKVTIYSMANGEPLSIPEYMAERTLDKRLGDGGFMFTAVQAKAPEYKRGTIKCFLHPESPDRPILDELGLSGISCPAARLSSLHSKRMHGIHRHKEEWDAYQEHMDDKKEAEVIAEQRAQTAAMLVLGEKAAGSAAETGGGDFVVEAEEMRCHSCNEIIDGRLADHICKERK